jgi:ATP-binding cassette, subfamily G (WHITE), member 1
LKSINGEFRGYELSAIMGPSGSGKSTMLNILSGFTSKHIGGIIKVNGNIANQKTIRRKSSYIMQENILHRFLTVYETMSFAINLKVGKRLSSDLRKSKVSYPLGQIQTLPM